MYKLSYGLLGIACMQVAVAAEDIQGKDDNTQGAESQQVEQKNTVTVTGQPLDNPTEMSAFRLDAAAIEARNAGNGNMLDLLKANPSVQFSEDDNSAKSGGQLKPGRISIHGNKFYENEILIDGVSNVNRLDPVTDNPLSLDDTVGNPERMFIDTGLIENISVYDHNIPARYGNFKGGVVDADLKKAGDKPQGSVSFRYTSDKWTDIKLNPDDQEDFDDSEMGLDDPTPFFTKKFYHVDYSTPLNDNLGILFSYDLKTSETPLMQMGELKDRSRSAENFFMKLDWKGDPGESAFLSFNHSPYTVDYFLKDKTSSDFETVGGADSITLEYKTPTKFGNYSLNTSLSRSFNSRDFDNNIFYNWLNTDSVTYGEGGYGDIDKEQLAFKVDQELSLKKFSALGGDHSVTAGLNFGTTNAEFDREQAIIYNSRRTDADVDCQGAEGCIDGEQYFYRRNIYEADSVDVTVNELAFYLEDRIEIGRFDLVPALRADYDDFFKNVNVAPRLAAAVKLNQSGNMRLTGGLNRYYSASALTYKLREARKPYVRQERALDGSDVPGDWTHLSDGTLTYSYSDLDTPYSDEANLGYHHSFDGVDLGLNFTYRKGHDEFARERITSPDGSSPYVLNNNGRSESKTWALTLSGNKPVDLGPASMSWSVGLTKNERYASHADFDDTLDEQDLEEYVIYDGKVIREADRPADNYNRPWIASAVLTFDVPAWNLTFTNSTRFVDGYEKHVRLADRVTTVLPDGSTEDLYSYVFDSFEPSVMFDWAFLYELPMSSTETFYSKLEISNVFNQSREIGDTTKPEYEMGRQAWLEMGYRF